MVMPERWLPNQEHGSWPKDAVGWIDKNPLPSAQPWKIFSTFNDGSYLIWRLPGRAKVYSDTRGFYYPGELLEDSYYLPQAKDGWQQRLERVLAKGTEYFLLPINASDFDPKRDLDFKLWTLLAPYIPQPLYIDPESAPHRFVLLSADQVRDAVSKLGSDTSSKNR
jgi:hypothetical protein